MTAFKSRIGVVAVGEVPDLIPRSIAANIQGILHLDIDLFPSLPMPAAAFDQGRLQYSASYVLQYLESFPSLSCDKVLGVLDGDLFVPILTYVFGEARQGGRCALVSLYRLKPPGMNSASDLSLLMERAAKVALHELGHLLDLHHCTDRGCLMHFAGGLKELDETFLEYCTYCRVFVRDAFLQKKERASKSD